MGDSRPVRGQRQHQRADPSRKGPRSKKVRSELERYEPPDVIERIMEVGAEGWEPFIADYSDFIRRCIRRLASDPDEQMDMYVHVCVRLRSDDCRRLKLFRGRGSAGPCQFTTWLATVVLNLGRECIRTKRGRRRLYRCVRRLPTMEQLVFRYRYWESLSAAEICRVLDWNHGYRVSDSEVDDVLNRLREKLGADGRWRLNSARNRSWGAIPLEEDGAVARAATTGLTQRKADCVQTARHRQALDVLRAAVGSLPDIERRALELRFAEELTARQAAERLGIQNFKQVYELQARGLLRLRRALNQADIDLSDFSLAMDASEILK